MWCAGYSVVVDALSGFEYLRYLRVNDSVRFLVWLVAKFCGTGNGYNLVSDELDAGGYPKMADAWVENRGVAPGGKLKRLVVELPED